MQNPLSQTIQSQVRKGVKLSAKIAELREQLAAVECDLLPVAKELRAPDAKSVSLKADATANAEACALKIEWPVTYKVDPEAATGLKRKLGKLWAEFFSVTTSINRAKGFGPRLRKASQDPKTVRLVELIEATYEAVEARVPKFKW